MLRPYPVFVVFSWLFVALTLGEFDAYSPWKSLLTFGVHKFSRVKAWRPFWHCGWPLLLPDLCFQALFSTLSATSFVHPINWAAANGGVTNEGLRGVWPPFLEIGQNQPFPSFFCLFRPFQRAQRAPGKSRKLRKKAFFLRYPKICLNPHLLNPHLWHPKSNQRATFSYVRWPIPGD